jgi:hypothetical protein
MHRTHGVDVSGVRVHRDDAARDESRRQGARALTRGDDILLPAEHGPLERGPARGLLAHELTHVVQQRRLGSSLPLEHSPAGTRLEREAQEAERRWRREEATASPEPAPPSSPPPAEPAPPPIVIEATGSIQRAVAEADEEIDEEDAAELSRRMVAELTESGFATLDASGALVFPFGGGASEEIVATEEEVPAVAAAPAARESAASPGARPAASGGRQGGEVPGDLATHPLDQEPGSVWEIQSRPVDVLDASPSPRARPSAQSGGARIAALSARAQSPAQLPTLQVGAPPAETAPATPPPAAEPPPPVQPPAEPAPPLPPPADDQLDRDPSTALDPEELERRLYRRLRTRLREELLIDRERAGLVTDLRRGV